MDQSEDDFLLASIPTQIDSYALPATSKNMNLVTHENNSNES